MSRSAARLWSRPFALACLASFTIWTASYTFIGVLTLAALRLGVAEARVGLLMAATTGCGLVAQLVAGRWLVGASRARWMRLGPLIVAAAALLAIAVPTPLALLGAGMLLGTGYGLTQTGAVVLTTEVAPPRQRGQAIGIYGTFTTLAVLVGPPLGVALLQQHGSAAAFTPTVLMALASTACGLLVRDPPRERGAARAERAPLPPLVYFAALALGGMTITWGTILTFVPVYALGLGLGNPGLYFSAQAASVVVLRAAMGGLSDRLGRVRVLVPATLLVVVGVAALAFRPPVWALLLSALVYGVGYAAFHPTTMSLADDVASPASRGTALALVGGAFSVGTGSGAILMGWVLAATSYETMFLVAAAVPLATTGALLLATRQTRAAAATPAPPPP